MIRFILFLSIGCVSTFAGSGCPDPMPTPTNLTATAVSPFQVRLDWMSTTDTGEYRVQRSPNGTNDWTEIIVLTATTNALHFTEKTLPGGLTFYYRIQGGALFEICSDCCTSDFSNVASATTPAGRVNCPLQVDLVRATIFFSRADSDTLKVRAFVCLPADFNVPSVAGNLQVCNAQIPFIFDHVGVGIYTFQTGNGLLHYSRRLRAWRFRAEFARENLAPDVTSCGLINANIAPPGVVEIVPVTVQIGDQSFSGNTTVLYHATANDRGIVR